MLKLKIVLFFILNVLTDSPPKVDEQRFEPEVSAGEGDYATLDCAVQGNPTPTITWRRGNLVVIEFLLCMYTI